MKIEDGTGQGYEQKVASNNRALVDSVSNTVEHHTNVDLGQGWVLVYEQTPSGANDFFFYFKNTDVVPYIFESMSYRVASAEQVKIYLDRTGTISGGTTLTPVNLNTGSAKEPTATIESGNNITGTTGGSVCQHIYMTSTESKFYNFESGIAVAPGGTFMMEAIAGSVQITINLHMYKLQQL
jgi:hypothetical protein